MTRDQNEFEPQARLAISGLPSLTDRMTLGGIYALVAETPPARFALLSGSLDDALREGIPCSVIVPAHPAAFIERIELFGQIDVHDRIAAGRLQFFVLQDDFAKKMFRFGAESFVWELDHFGVPENSYLVFDQADDLFSLHDPSLAIDQIETLRQWVTLRKVCALLVFSRLNAAGVNTLQALMDQMAGICRVGGARDGLNITFDYWQSGEGTIAAKNYHLRPLDSGLYCVADESLAPRDPSKSREVEAEVGVRRFFYMDPDLAGMSQQVPGEWRQVDTLVGMMHATRETRSATVIFNYEAETDLRQLAEAIHTLRFSLGRRGRLVVREKGASLRYQNEALLLKLGLSLVVHRDVPPSRLPLLLETLNGQLFNRDVDINFETALASVMPSGRRGYLTPTTFAREAENIVERAAILDIPCAMVIGAPARDSSLREVLRNARMSRAGDLISTDANVCYLFLSGCPEADLSITIERIFGRPAEAMFDEVEFVVRRAMIRDKLKDLLRAAEDGKLPDYSTTPEAQDPAPASAPIGQAETGLSLPPESPTHAVLRTMEERAPLPPTWAMAAGPAQATPPADDPHQANRAERGAASVQAIGRKTSAQAHIVERVQTRRGSAEQDFTVQNRATFGKRDAPRATRVITEK